MSFTRENYDVAEQQSADFPLLVSRERAENAFGDALRLFVGRGRRYSVKQLSNATGVKDRAIECALCPSGDVDFRPLNMGQTLSIIKFLGPLFTSEWLVLADQQAVFVSPAEHDDLAGQCIEFAGEYSAARHPDSEAGVDIGPGEHKRLKQKARHLKAVA